MMREESAEAVRGTGIVREGVRRVNLVWEKWGVERRWRTVEREKVPEPRRRREAGGEFDMTNGQYKGRITRRDLRREKWGRRGVGSFISRAMDSSDSVGGELYRGGATESDHIISSECKFKVVGR